jgi:hypothetical protein
MPWQYASEAAGGHLVVVRKPSDFCWGQEILKFVELSIYVCMCHPIMCAFSPLTSMYENKQTQGS